MPHLPYQPRPAPFGMGMAPLATTPPPRAAEPQAPLPPAAPTKPKAPKSRPTSPRMRSKTVGLDTISIDEYEPDPEEVYRFVTGGNSCE